MNIVGDLERLFAAVYPYRWLIGFTLLAAAVVVLTTALRRDWFAPVRRHSRLASVVAGAALVIILPVGYYLASPLWTRVELTEASPLTQADGGTVVASGQFSGVDELHYGQGTVSAIETAPGAFVLYFDAFSVQNGPDLYVYLSPSATGYAEGALELGVLQATDGSFSYAVPAGVDPRAYGSVIIWCKQFAFLFATAPLAAV